MGAVLGKMGLASITNGWSETKSRELITAIICSNTFVEQRDSSLLLGVFGKEKEIKLLEQKVGQFGGGYHRANRVTHVLIFTSATARMRCSYARSLAQET